MEQLYCVSADSTFPSVIGRKCCNQNNQHNEIRTDLYLHCSTEISVLLKIILTCSEAVQYKNKQTFTSSVIWMKLSTL